MMIDRAALLARQGELRSRLQELASQSTQLENQISSQQQALQAIRAEGLKLAGALEEVTKILSTLLPEGVLDGQGQVPGPRPVRVPLPPEPEKPSE
jgi:hypothetical protein